MDDRILKFLDNNRVSSLSIILPDDTSHSAALHYSHKNFSDGTIELYFSTENTSRKCQGILNGETKNGSLVIGFSEEEWITLQMDGKVQGIMDKEELTKVKSIHYPKHPSSRHYENDPATFFLKFTPYWWRYTDYNQKPLLILES